jgi:hypothetical protein
MIVFGKAKNFYHRIVDHGKTIVGKQTNLDVAEPLELFQLKCPSHTCKGSNTLKPE